VCRFWYSSELTAFFFRGHSLCTFTSSLILLLAAKDPRLWTEFHVGFKEVAKAKGYSEHMMSRSKGQLRPIRFIQRYPYVAQTLWRFIVAGEGRQTEKLYLRLEEEKARGAAFRFIQRTPKLKELTIVSDSFGGHFWEFRSCGGFYWSFLLWLLWVPRLEMLRFEMSIVITITLRQHPDGEGEQDLNSILGYVCLSMNLPRGSTDTSSRKACGRDQGRTQRLDEHEWYR
jgi:hypothetical protein